MNEPNPGADTDVFISGTADVSGEAAIGNGVRVWDLVQIREAASIGDESIIGRGAYIDHGVVIGQRCKIQNAAQVFAPARLGNGVFIGPGAILSNDRYPRAVGPDGTIKGSDDWAPTGVVVHDGAAVGAGSVIIGGTSIGAWAVIGAGAVVTTDVKEFSLVVGSPARHVGWVDKNGVPLKLQDDGTAIGTDGHVYSLSDEGLEIVG